MTIGWVALLKKLQPAGRNDYLVARVKLPSRLLLEAQEAAARRQLHEGHILGLPGGIYLGPKLIVHLQVRIKVLVGFMDLNRIRDPV